MADSKGNDRFFGLREKGVSVLLKDISACGQNEGSKPLTNFTL